MTVGNYGYADGVLFVRLSMAFDALLAGSASPAATTCRSPTWPPPRTLFLVPMNAVDMAQERHSRQGPLVVVGQGWPMR
jgi:hypothetical protein